MPHRQQITVQIEGMTCADCAVHVRKALSALSGIEEVRLSTWQAGEADVLAAADVPDDAIVKAVESAGYRARVSRRRSVEQESKAPGAEPVDYDLAIVGGGSAAFSAAIKGAELGAKVAIIEHAAIGGTCVNIGCVPSKTLIRAAEHCYHSISISR